MDPRPHRTSTLTRTLLVVGVLAVIGAGASSASVLDTDPIVGFWNFGGGVVQVTGGPTSFTGTIGKATQFSSCVHPVGEVIWRIQKTASGYSGSHQWFGSAAPECKLGGAADRGAANWTIIDSDASYVLRFCTTSPTGSSSPCDDLTRAKPVAMTWPKLPDALVSLESVSNGCGGGPAGDDPKYGDDSEFADTEIPFDNWKGFNKARRYHVNFREACKQHDAGYSHAKVRDMKLNGGNVIDYFDFTKKMVDDKFLVDMRKICDSQIPPEAKVARRNCKQNGGFHFVSGAKTRYNVVAATSYSQVLWQGLGFYQQPPRLGGTWTAVGASIGSWEVSQFDRIVIARWTGGPSAPNLSGEFRGTIISRDDDSRISGYARTTNGVVVSPFRKMNIYWSPKTPDELLLGTGLKLSR